MSRFNFSICSCVRPNRGRGGEKLTQWVLFLAGGGAGYTGSVAILERECMCASACEASGVTQTWSDVKKSTNKVKNPSESEASLRLMQATAQLGFDFPIRVVAAFFGFFFSHVSQMNDD